MVENAMRDGCIVDYVPDKRVQQCLHLALRRVVQGRCWSAGCKTSQE